MSIYFSGALKRSGGVSSAITKQIKNVNLKPVKRITVAFDPFAENINSTRDFLFLLSTPRVIQTNPNCLVKTEIVCDRKPAIINLLLTDSAQEKIDVKDIRLLSSELTTLELLQLYNKHITPLAPIEEDITSKVEKVKPSTSIKKTKRSK